MPRLNPQEAEALFEPEKTQPLPRVSSLVDRRKEARRGEDRRKNQEPPLDERRVEQRRRHKRRRSDTGF